MLALSPKSAQFIFKKKKILSWINLKISHLEGEKRLWEIVGNLFKTLKKSPQELPFNKLWMNELR